MCQMNIDAYQGEVNRHFQTDFQMPILFFTQLDGPGLRAGRRGRWASAREVVSAQAALGKIGIEVPSRAPEPVGAAPRQAARAAGEEGPGAADAAHAGDEEASR